MGDMLRDLLDGVTEGPWIPFTQENESGAWVDTPKEYFPVGYDVRGPANARFIATARNLWPLLADLQEAARALSLTDGDDEETWERLEDALARLHFAIEDATPPETAEPEAASD